MMNFQEMIARLTQFWAEQGCVVHQGYDLEVGAGTFNPATFLRCLGPEPYSAVYVEPSRRPKDGRYGDNPNRVQFYHQMQVIMKPSPPNIQDLYLQSLEAIGMKLNEHDMRFVHDDWENPTIGAWGLGWEVWSDGMEVSQFTYFQAVGGLPVSPVTGEITYGLERLAMYIQGVDSMFDLKWNDKITYGDIFKRNEWEWSHYNFHQADAQMWLRHFEDYEREVKRLVVAHLPIPAYDFVMKASHAFNILDARGVISVTERTGYITRIRNLAKLLAESYIASREQQEFPLMRKAQAKQETLAPAAISDKGDPSEKEDFLLEIGSEELPATFVPIGVQNLENQMRALLAENDLKYEELHAYGTPRRLAILIKGLAGGSAAKQIEKKGPALGSAFDAAGNPTKAGEGFFRSLQIAFPTKSQVLNKEIPGLEIRTLKDVDYLFANQEQKGVSTRALWAQSLPKLILDVEFPKKMRWSDLTIEYARPLRWLVALYGNETIPFSVANLTSSNVTYGHRQLAHHAISLNKAADYLETLRTHYVMADIKERRASIEEQLSQIEQKLNAKATAKEKVMPQVLHLVEWPFLTAGTFDKRFLAAPKEVLICEMVEHQKYFPVVDASGNLVSHFIIVCNNKPTDLIRAGNQKALGPRLTDGMFLYEEDLKVPLERFNDKLKNMTFQKELGSVWDKVERISSIVEILHKSMPLADLQMAKKAASLCKADLATELVGEFPELQGFVGKLYAQKQGEKPEVALAIDEHWMPRGEKAPLPQSGCGILASLADKIDNFLSCYALDLKPTSSSDPYALRRQALGLLKMLIEGKHHLSLHKVFSESFEVLLRSPALDPKKAAEIKSQKETLLTEIFAFFANRFRTLLNESGFEKDEIEAVLHHGLDDVFNTYSLIQDLHNYRKTHREDFLKAHEVYTRSKKILSSQKTELYKVDPKLFVHPSEETLFAKIEKIKSSPSTTLKESLSSLKDLQEPLNNLFDSVKIMDDDLKVRTNRLGLLQEVWSLCNTHLDFSKIQEHA